MTTRRRKTPKLKGRKEATAARRHPPSAADLQKQLDQRSRELVEAQKRLAESLEQQTATAQALQVISSSPGELEPVFQTMLANAMKVCEAKLGFMNRYDGATWKIVAVHGAVPAYTEYLQQQGYRRPGPETVVARIASTKQTVQVVDLPASRGYMERDPVVVAAVERGGVRTILGVPMLKEEGLIGAIILYRQEVRPFAERQIALVQNFAAQAVIAIENTRLLNELRQRTDDLTESLEQQTATSEVLKVISSSPGELEPVFNAMLENATRLCAAKFGTLYLREGDAFRAIAMHNVPPALAEVRRRDPLAAPGGTLSRLVNTKKIVHVPDTTADPAYIDRHPWFVMTVELGGFRALLNVPMLKEGELVGAIVIYRQEVGPFTDKQIALMQNFAAQAVIAIENTRLLNELRQRTTDLTESLEQQTAISEILRVISNSPSDVQPVLASVAEHASRICGAKYAEIFVIANDMLQIAATFGDPGHAGTEPLPLDRSSISGRSVIDAQPIHVADLQQAGDEFARGRDLAKRFGHHTTLAVPLIREGRALGNILIRRTEVRPFEQKHIALLSTFADQAAIAIENVRLSEAEQQRTRELGESLEQQTATAEVLKIISRSTFDLQSVLDTLVESAARLCDADMVSINRAQEDGYRAIAMYGFSPELKKYVSEHPIPGGKASVVGRTVMEGSTIQIPDVTADPDYKSEFVKTANIRTLLGVPLLREGTPTGVIALMRHEVRPFTEKQIELVATFADQAVIAIENVRLFEEIQEKSRQVEEASKHKSQFLANMSHELRTPLNAILGYTELVLDGIYGEAPEKMRNVLERIQTNGKHLLGLINDVLDLSKIEAGQLVLSLNEYSIKDMMQGVYVAIEPLAGNKKLSFKLEVPSDLPRAH